MPAHETSRSPSLAALYAEAAQAAAPLQPGAISGSHTWETSQYSIIPVRHDLPAPQPAGYLAPGRHRAETDDGPYEETIANDDDIVRRLQVIGDPRPRGSHRLHREATTNYRFWMATAVGSTVIGSGLVAAGWWMQSRGY